MVSLFRHCAGGVPLNAEAARGAGNEFQFARGPGRDPRVEPIGMEAHFPLDIAGEAQSHRVSLFHPQDALPGGQRAARYCEIEGFFGRVGGKCG